MACCKCEEYRWPDPQEPIWTDPGDGKQYCLFHAPADHKGVSVEYFNQKVFERIDAVNKWNQDSKMKARCHFTGTIFPGEISFISYGKDNPLPALFFDHAHFYEAVKFSYAHFEGKVGFNDTCFTMAASFRSAHFNEEARFGAAKFMEETYFSYAHFERETTFKSSCFLKKAYFESALFEQGVCFTSAHFGEETSFMSTQFRGTSYFNYAKFMGVTNFNITRFDSAYFLYAHFEKKTNFISSQFKGNAVFDESFFKEASDFLESRFEQFAGFVCTIFAKKVSFHRVFFGDMVRFSGTHFVQEANFRACFSKGQVVFDQVDLEAVTLFNTPIESMSFINCVWGQRKKHQIIYDDIDNPSKEEAFLYEHHRRLEDTYRRLKKAAKRDNDEFMASNWHWQEKEHMRKRLALDKGRFGKLKSLWVPASLYKWASGYGESPGRAFLVLLGVVALPFVILGSIKLAETGLHPSFDQAAVREVGNDWLRCFPIFKAPVVKYEYPFWKSFLSLSSQILITLQAAFFGLAWRNKFRR